MHGLKPLRIMLGVGLLAPCIAAASGAAFGEAQRQSGPQRLTGAMLREMVAGSVIALDTPLGTKVPMRFGRDGLVSGEAGILASFLGSAKDRGRWWVAKDQLCIKWFRWFNSEPRCMEIRLDGNRITWRRDDGDTGTGTVTERGTAAAVKAGPPPAKPKAIETATEIELAQAVPPAPPAGRPDQPALTDENASAGPPLPAPLPPAAALGGPLGTSPDDPNPSRRFAQADVGATASIAAASPPPTDSTDSPAQVAARPRAPLENPAASVERPEPTAKRSAAAAVPAKQKPLGQAAPAAGAQATRKQPPVKPAEPTFRVARVGFDDMLNVRSGPSEAHPAIGVISPRGRGVRITGSCVAEWCPIRHAGVRGWVNRYYLAAE